MKMGDGDREGSGRKVPQKSYRQRPARVRARVKWWGKSPPRQGQPRRHGKPRAVQDRTGEGLPARYKPRVIVAPRASGAPRSGGVREMTVQPRNGWTESGLQGSGIFFPWDRKPRERSRANDASRPPEEEAASRLDGAERSQSGLQGSGIIFLGTESPASVREPTMPPGLRRRRPHAAWTERSQSGLQSIFSQA
jgi:hypothetical protein